MAGLTSITVDGRVKHWRALTCVHVFCDTLTMSVNFDFQYTPLPHIEMLVAKKVTDFLHEVSIFWWMKLLQDGARILLLTWIGLLTHSPTHSLTYLLTYTLHAYSLTHTHSFTYPFIHSLTDVICNSLLAHSHIHIHTYSLFRLLTCLLIYFLLT